MTQRINFGKLRDVLEIPDLIGLQINSYGDFLQRDVKPEERKNQGLQEVFNEIFPIESFDKQMSLEFGPRRFAISIEWPPPPVVQSTYV